jgi:chondroitin AC lyase
MVQYKRMAGMLVMALALFAISGYGQVSEIRNHCRQLLLSDTVYATEQSYRVTDDVQYNTDGPGYFHSISRDGHWSDIDYHSDLRGDWKPSWHLYRVMLLCRMYYKNHDPAYLEAVHRALRFWITNDFQCSNWWQNQINTPFAFSSLLLMLDKDATPEELAYLDNVLIKRVLIYKATGQNLIWQLDNQARIALIQNDYSSLAGIIANMQKVVSVSSAEGIQPDYSFQQHGPMLQFGNYGLHFVNSLLFWMTVTAGTPLAFRPDKQQILFDYCSEGLRWTVYKGAMDITAIGRQLRANCGKKRGDDLYDDFGLLQSFDKADACKYVMDGFVYPGMASGMEAAPGPKGKPACDLEGNKSFWRSDYMVQLAKDRYMMSVKMNGSFVKRIESINGENLMGAFLNDGVTLIQRTGREYHNIEALWNWAMLPGVTGDTTIDPRSKEATASASHSDFVGQVSDTTEGISAMYYNRLGIHAYKSVFLLDGMMIALGAGITSAHKENLVTTVNQRYYKGGELYSDKSRNGQTWLWQDSTAYLFMGPNQQVKTTTDLRPGDWNIVDKASPDRLVADSLITIYLPHADQDSYAYIIKPGIGREEAGRLAEENPVRVLANTAGLQAVQINHRIMAVFYTPGELKIGDNLSIKADKPCMVICKPGVQGNKDGQATEDGQATKIWVADPTRTQQTITLTVNGHDLSIKLPAGDYAGSTTGASY